jgi:hypothetical protein
MPSLRIDNLLPQPILDLSQKMQEEAMQRYAGMRSKQSGLDWHDVRAWMLARAAGKPCELNEIKLDYK